MQSARYARTKQTTSRGVSLPRLLYCAFLGQILDLIESPRVGVSRVDLLEPEPELATRRATQHHTTPRHCNLARTALEAACVHGKVFASGDAHGHAGADPGLVSAREMWWLPDDGGNGDGYRRRLDILMILTDCQYCSRSNYS